MSWLVGSSVEVSIVLMRIASALILTALLALTTWLLPPRYQLVLFLTVLTTFTTQGYFLLASINPSSWSVVGVGVGWLALHAALAPGKQSKNHRGALAAAGLLAWIMAIGSRWDAVGFVALTAVMTSFQLAWVRFPKYRKLLPLGTLVLGLALCAVVEKYTFIDPFSRFGKLFVYKAGDPDNIAFLTQNFLNGFPNAIKAFGEVAAHPGLLLPGYVFPLAVILLSFYMSQTFNRTNPVQISGFILIGTAISLLFMAWHSSNVERDGTELSSRYSLPLLVFAAGWWYLLGPADLASRVLSRLRSTSIVATVLFALTVFTYAERYVDVQTLGIRYLPEGLDQWWWVWMPVGPNVVVALAIVCLWKFFNTFRLGVTLAESENSSV